MSTFAVFFFQAEDGIRAGHVTGVQTCALPISDGNRRRDISFATGMASMAMSFFAGFERWAYGIGPSHHDRYGRTDVWRGSSDQSGAIALTMSLCLASSTFVICSNRTKNITTGPARTYHCRRTHRSYAL